VMTGTYQVGNCVLTMIDTPGFNGRNERDLINLLELRSTLKTVDFVFVVFSGEESSDVFYYQMFREWFACGCAMFVDMSGKYPVPMAKKKFYDDYDIPAGERIDGIYYYSEMLDFGDAGRFPSLFCTMAYAGQKSNKLKNHPFRFKLTGKMKESAMECVGDITRMTQIDMTNSQIQLKAKKEKVKRLKDELEKLDQQYSGVSRVSDLILTEYCNDDRKIPINSHPKSLEIINKEEVDYTIDVTNKSIKLTYKKQESRACHSNSSTRALELPLGISRKKRHQTTNEKSQQRYSRHRWSNQRTRTPNFN